MRLREFFLFEADEADAYSIKLLAQHGFKPGDRVKWYDRQSDGYLTGQIRLRSNFKGVSLVNQHQQVLVKCDQRPNVQMGVRLDELIPENDPTPLH